MRIAILGTGHLAEALGACWVRAGHRVTVAGRVPERAEALAARLNRAALPGARGDSGAVAAEPAARAATPRDVVRGADAVLLAVPWDAAAEVVEAAGGADGSWAGLPVIDPTNPVGHGVGVVLNPPGVSNAQRIADAAPGSHVVKGFHLVPSTQWGSAGAETTVVLCGDDPAALETTSTLVRDAGAVPAVLGPLARARQLEEAAGLLIALAFAGVDARTVVPALPPVQV
ncbi:NAD(P)-binding domain-containing protein [Nocardia sp. NPDC024068]|uniref:NADPH-dependent F420 reductase n=1 Tax=Nocardia sp. NPDC024068 TaxID=3157197 RepID=UPI0033CCBFF8